MVKDDTKRNGWNAEELGEQSSYEKETEITRRVKRGDETLGDPDQRDVAGGVPTKDTPHGREARDRPHDVKQESEDERSDTTTDPKRRRS